MPTVRFEPGRFGPAASAEVPEGGRLVDVCDEAGAPVPFSCRGASCGICLVEVLAGAELLRPPREAELDMLERVAASPPERRLACQAVLRPGPGLVRLRCALG